MMRDIGKNIRDLRQQKHLTQEELAEQLFVTRQTVSNYENGRTRPDVDQILRLAEIFDTDANAVLYGPPVPEGRKTALIQAAAGCGLTAAIYLLYRFFLPTAQDIQSFHYDPRWTAALMYVVRPVFLLLLGWSLVQVLSLAAAVKLPEKPWVRCLRRGSFGHCSLRYPVLTLCLYRLLRRCRECILGSQAVSLSDHKVESKTDFPSPFGCASLSSGLSAEAKGPGRKTDFSIKATVP